MPNLKYPKISPQEKVELLDYWESHRTTYSVVAQYFERKWNKKINVGVVADIVLQWKKYNYIRGLSHISMRGSALALSVMDAMSIIDGCGIPISKKCIYSMCIGEMNDQETTSFLTMDSLDAVFRNGGISIDEMYIPAEVTDEAQTIQELLKDYPPSRIFFLDSFNLFFRCPPYRSYAYIPAISRKVLPREKAEIVVYVSADGSVRSKPFLFSRRLTTLDGSESLVQTRKRRERIVSAEALASVLRDLDAHVAPGNKCLLLMENMGLLVQGISENERTFEVKLTSQSGYEISVHLQSVRIVLLKSKLFYQLSPLCSSLINSIRMKYKSQLVHAITDKMLNRRGYKRIIPYDECYRILQSVWDSIHADHLSTTPGSSSFFSTLSSDVTLLEALETESETDLRDSLEMYQSSFSVSPEECLNLEQYKYLEYIPYLAGIGVLRDYLRTPQFMPILFNNPDYPEAPFFPPSSFFLHSQQQTTEELPPSEDVVLVPNPEIAKAFITCLESVVNASDVLRSDRDIYDDFIRRVSSHFDL